MQSGLVKAVCQIGIFMICAQAIIHFRPKASYEKYLKMLLSAMIMIQIFASLSGIFSKDGQGLLAERIAYFTEYLEESMQQASNFSSFSEEGSQFEILGELPETLEEEKSAVEIGEISVQIAPVSPISVGERAQADSEAASAQADSEAENARMDSEAAQWE